MSQAPMERQPTPSQSGRQKDLASEHHNGVNIQAETYTPGVEAQDVGTPRTWPSVADLQARCADLEQQLRAQEKQTKAARDNMTAAMRDFQNLQKDSVVQVDDEWVKSAMISLRFNIEQWSIRWAKHPGSKAYFNFNFNKLNPQIASVCRDFYNAFNNEGLRPFVLQASMWIMMQEEVFGCALWAGDHGPAFSNLKKRFSMTTPDSQREVHNWRAMTAGMLYRETSPEDRLRRIRSLATEIEDRFKICISLPRDRSFRDQLEGIIDEAVALDAQLSMPRASFVIPKCPRARGEQYYTFRVDTMEDEKCLKEPARNDVACILNPCLCKFGNARGEHYEQVVILVKSQVLRMPTWKKLEEEGNRARKQRQYSVGP